MKSLGWLMRVIWISSAAGVLAAGHGHFGGGRSVQMGYHGQRNFAGRFHNRGRFGFGFYPRAIGNQGFGNPYSKAFYRHQYFSPGFFAPFYWSSAYEGSSEETEVFLPEFESGLQLYYQKAPPPDVKPNCNDPWKQNFTPNSVSQVMSRMFELQCQNMHSGSESELKNPTGTDGKDTAPEAPPSSTIKPD
jgi:hypothetical protein